MAETVNRKLFVFPDVKFPHNHHDGGGCVVIAYDAEGALKLLADREIKMKTPPQIYRLAENYSEEVFEFPDAGCC